jgi:superfamily II DNA helicase RecQ
MDLYQQSGRAGRDGADAACCLVTYRGDIHGGTDSMAPQGRTDAGARSRALLEMRGMRDYLGLGPGSCRQQYLTRDFVTDGPGERCRACDLCQKAGSRALETVGPVEADDELVDKLVASK